MQWLRSSRKLDIFAGTGRWAAEVVFGIGGNGPLGGGGGGSALFLPAPIRNHCPVLGDLLAETGDLLRFLIRGFPLQLDASVEIGSAGSSNICNSCRPSVVRAVPGLANDSSGVGSSSC